ncbi:MAG: LAGLIDADG family homing endonuclease [Methylophaga sp.]|nr:LAGLIDADG family homing endonuclease [Methylophaga sp.]
MNELVIINYDALSEDSIQRNLLLAWAAGFIDGEGCIHIYKQKYNSRVSGKPGITHSLRITIGQNNLEVLEKLAEALGVHTTLHKTKRSFESNRQCYTLHINGKHALEAIRRIKPYLVRKLPEAEAALRFWVEGQKDLKTGRKPVPKAVMEIREWYYKKMGRLK